MENQDQRENNSYPVYQNLQAESYSAPSHQNRQSPNGLATASLVMGILAVVMTCCCYGDLFSADWEFYLPFCQKETNR